MRVRDNAPVQWPLFLVPYRAVVGSACMWLDVGRNRLVYMPKLVDARTETSLDTYETPQALVSQVKAFFGGIIDLDPCTTERNPTGARWHVTEQMNGLDRSWSSVEMRYGGGTVRSAYVNSPYGRALPDWTAKCVRESLYNDVEIIQLMPARFGARWFQFMAAEAAIFGVFKKRLFFTLDGKPVVDSKGKPCSAQFDACLAYYGPRVSEFRKHFEAELTYWQLIS